MKCEFFKMFLKLNHFRLKERKEKKIRILDYIIKKNVSLFLTVLCKIDFVMPIITFADYGNKVPIAKGTEVKCIF